jgi:hypothetical protein
VQPKSDSRLAALGSEAFRIDVCVPDYADGTRIGAILWLHPRCEDPTSSTVRSLDGAERSPGTGSQRVEATIRIRFARCGHMPTRRTKRGLAWLYAIGTGAPPVTSMRATANDLTCINSWSARSCLIMKMTEVRS